MLTKRRATDAVDRLPQEAIRPKGPITYQLLDGEGTVLAQTDGEPGTAINFSDIQSPRVTTARYIAANGLIVDIGYKPVASGDSVVFTPPTMPKTYKVKSATLVLEDGTVEEVGEIFLTTQVPVPWPSPML